MSVAAYSMYIYVYTAAASLITGAKIRARRLNRFVHLVDLTVAHHLTHNIQHIHGILLQVVPLSLGNRKAAPEGEEKDRARESKIISGGNRRCTKGTKLYQAVRLCAG